MWIDNKLLTWNVHIPYFCGMCLPHAILSHVQAKSIAESKKPKFKRRSCLSINSGKAMVLVIWCEPSVLLYLEDSHLLTNRR